MKHVVCITCPKGCRITVDENNGYRVEGNGCERGVEYAVNEVKHPVRVITSTVKVHSSGHPRCPVKLDRPIRKERIFDAMKTLDGICLTPPIRTGQVVVQNVCGEGVDFVATRDIAE